MPRIVFAAAAEADLFGIYEYLTLAYQEFGEPAQTASASAEAKVLGIRADIERLLLKTRSIGTLREDIAPSLRFVPVGRVVVWFDPTQDGARVLGIFLAGQDHQARMLTRLLG